MGKFVGPCAPLPTPPTLSSVAFITVLTSLAESSGQRMCRINVTCLLPCRREPLQGSVEKRLAVLLSMGLCDAFALLERWTLYFCLQSLKQVEFSLSVGAEIMLVLSSFLPDLPWDSHFSLQNPWLLVYSWRFPESSVLFCV